MKKIYLDVCSLCRPFDDQGYARISLETDAVNLILSNVRNRKFALMKSPVHIAEINGIKDDFEREELLRRFISQFLSPVMINFLPDAAGVKSWLIV